MKKIIVLFLLFFFLNPLKTSASSYYYPLEKTLQRPQYKKFGQYIDSNFYQNTGNLYPSKFIGYHAGIDLEIFPTEENQSVPVYAVSDGEILFIDPISGYGGLILLKTNSNLTFLYGHLNLSQINLKTGNTVQAGQKIAYLGDAFSSQTGSERKHLHFALYKGEEEYFKGYEPTLEKINSNWLNPILFLKQNNAVEPNINIPTKNIKKSLLVSENKTSSFWSYIYKIYDSLILKYVKK